MVDGCVDYAHFGITCSSWGVLSSLNGGTRTVLAPYGNGTLAREIRGNWQLQQMMKIIRHLNRRGKFWSIENPRTSRLWHTRELKSLMRRPDVVSVTFAQCQYFLRPLDPWTTMDLLT